MERCCHRILVGVIAISFALSGCGGSEPDRNLSELAEQGRQVALTRGCSACHGENGEGGVGPAWQGLAGSSVALEGGGAVVADAAYLRQSMVDPQAEIVEGTTIAMPISDLSETEIAALITYIEELR